MTHDELMAAKCELCGEPMPPGEEMFVCHGYSGPCPKPPLDDNSHVAWCRYTDRTIATCDSDAEGAFRVYRHQELHTADSERLARQVAELNRRYDRALAALRKIQKAYRRVGWEHGPTMEEAIDSVDAILTDEKIEADIERGKS